MTSRFAKAIGVWEIDLCKPKLELKPTMRDVKEFRNILINEKTRKNRALLFDNFGDFIFNLINAQYPTECQLKDENGDNEVRTWVELYLSPLLEEAMVAFKWATKEELEKTKKESVKELKKVMSDV